MNLITVIRRSLTHYARSNWGVIFGAAVSTAALAGALVVGDSMRSSLLRKSLEGLGPFHYAMRAGDRFFRTDLAPKIEGTGAQGIRFCSLLNLEGIASANDGAARANGIQLLGVGPDFLQLMGARTALSAGQVLVNPAVAAQLRIKVGDEILLRLPKPGALSREVTLTDRENNTVGIRVQVADVLPAGEAGNFSLLHSQLAPLNVFLPLDDLTKAAGLSGKANVMLATEGRSGRKPERLVEDINAALREVWRPDDAALEFRVVNDTRQLELRSPRVFLDSPIIEASRALPDASNAIPVLTYLANLIESGTNSTPYSFVTAAGPPYTPADLKEDEILLSQWLADDLGAKAGDRVQLTYFVPEAGARLVEASNTFAVRDIVPAKTPWMDRTLMPDFPGIEKAESTGDWEVGFELVHPIRPKDEAYWKQFRGTPKAYVSLAAGQKMWASRFGELTALRWPLSDSIGASASRADLLMRALQPSRLGLTFEPVREQAIHAAAQSQDFGQLFIGFSFFVIAAALLLTGLLFQFSIEQRAAEAGTLLALGFQGRTVRRLLLAEGAGLAAIGGLLGVMCGLLYAKGMLWGLGTLWRDAVGVSGFELRASPASLAIGWVIGVVVATGAVWLTVRRQSRTPALELLGGGYRTPDSGRGKVSLWLLVVGLAGALGITTWALLTGQTTNAGAFFGAGVLLLVSGVSAVSLWFSHLSRAASGSRLTLSGLAVRGNTHRRKRAVTTVGLLASGCFVIAAIGAFRLDAARDAQERRSGTGGFQFIGESTLPVVHDLETKAGQEFYGLSPEDLASVSIIPMRLRSGDDASCLNLNRAQKPRVLGVRPERLKERFTFAQAAKGLDRNRGWDLLRVTNENATEIPAIGDANSIKYALGKSVGDTIDYTDERGRTVRLRLVASLANSILQGNLVIDEAAFLRLFPGESGYRVFLVQTAGDKAAQTSAALTRALQDAGLEMISTVDRLNAFNSVQNTYLGAFQILGGLGLLLGSAGLGMVVLRNVFERRGELGLMNAVGFSRVALGRLLLGEHVVLLALGLGLGVVAAALAVLPALTVPGRPVPLGSLGITLAAVALNGISWTWIATRWALRGDPLDALRNE
jgi:ABC-type antimicrobial peptide transport system permease subunit